ncbi:MAG: hypothetical protein ACR2QA_08545 [Solirubrobacteraceae bacterium]
MKLTRVYTSADGGSAFEEVDVELREAGAIGRLSEWIEADSVAFRENDADYDYDWHCAPARQLIVLLDGAIEIEVTSGEKRAFRGGDVLLMEDTSGRGHRTRTTDGRSRRSIFIRLGADVKLPLR